MASQKWKPKPAAITPRAANLKGLHRHGCSVCSATYEDTCLEPEMNRGCVTCRLGRPQPLWGLSLAPASCCYAESHRATKEECTRYRLAGDSPWWICATCKRPHIFKPNMKAMV